MDFSSRRICAVSRKQIPNQIYKLRILLNNSLLNLKMLTFYCVYFNDAANKISGCEIVRDLIQRAPEKLQRLKNRWLANAF